MRFDSKDHARRNVDQRIEKLDDKGEDLSQKADDIDLIKKLVNDIKDGGTSDARDAVEAAVRDAKSEIRERFEDDHGELQQEQERAEQLEQEVTCEARADTDNAREIAQARSDLNTESAAEPLDRAAGDLKDEAEALDAEAERLHDRTEISLQEAQRLVQRVMHGE